MKKNILIFTLFLLSCNHKTETEKIETDSKFDSLILQSKKNITIANDFSNKGDSSITKKIDNTIKKINNLEKQVEDLKIENNELKSNLDDANDAGQPYQFLPVSDNQKN